MEKNNDPSTGSGTNKSPNVKELTDEQLKEVAGGREFKILVRGMGCNLLASVGCQNYDTEQCKCLD